MDTPTAAGIAMEKHGETGDNTSVALAKDVEIEGVENTVAAPQDKGEKEKLTPEEKKQKAKDALLNVGQTLRSQAAESIPDPVYDSLNQKRREVPTSSDYIQELDMVDIFGA